MRDQDGRVARGPRQVHEGRAERGSRDFVEVTERLVGQEQRGLDDEGARQRHALAHASRQLVGIRLLEAREPEPIEPGPRALDLIAWLLPQQLERQPHVVDRRPPRQQSVLLEDGGEHAAEVIELVVGHAPADDDTAIGRAIEADEEVQERGLPAAGLADDGHELALGDDEVETLDGHHRLTGAGLVEDLAQRLDLDRSRAGHARQRSTRSSTRVRTASARNRMTTRISVQAKTSDTENSSWATTRP